MAQFLRVHIVPLGFDTPERVTKPLKELRADKAYMLTNIKDSPRANEEREKVMTILNKMDYCKVELRYVDIWNLFSCIPEIRKIFVKERGNHVCANVSTGSKVLSIAAMISCMLWDGTPYYTHLDYSQDPPKVTNTEILPVYAIDQPDEQILKVLTIINRSKGKITKKDLIAKLQSDSSKLIPTYGKNVTRTAPHSKLRGILDPMEEDWKFVQTRPLGRKRLVTITEKGRKALTIFGEREDLDVPTSQP